jgi:hypothetical protein
MARRFCIQWESKHSEHNSLQCLEVRVQARRESQAAPAEEEAKRKEKQPAACCTIPLGSWLFVGHVCIVSTFMHLCTHRIHLPRQLGSKCMNAEVSVARSR